MERNAILKQYFGHAAFRPGQEALIDAVLAGRDVFGIMPTGGGKSLCYQIPALLLPGITLVVSPLISLMKDQVAALKESGVDAAFLNSSLTGEQMKTAYRNLRGGAYKIVYVAPERLGGDGFVSLMRELDISLVAVDEAHCISQWGQDFRLSYLKIVEFLEKLPRRPVVAAFTATATEQVRGDVHRILNLREPLCITTGFDRPNLYFEVQKPKSKQSTLRALVQARRGKSGIVYCATRKGVEQVCDALGASATRYHAGLDDHERRKNQEDFLYDRKTIMVATNAFGMGIDKSNVSFVIHYNMPKSIEAYYQEAGRAGRDGAPADCILLYSAGDIQTAKFFIENASENEELTGEEREFVIKQDYKRLDAMVAYCKLPDCLRGRILDYFGQEHPPNCGNCGNCRAHYTECDITEQAQMILSCVKRAKDRLGYHVGATLIAHTLHGSTEKRVVELGLNKLTTYALMRTTPRPTIRNYIEHLETAGYLRTDPEHGGVSLTESANAVLFQGKAVTMTVKETPAVAHAEQPKRDKKTVRETATDAPPDLFEHLRILRYALSQTENIPAYLVFSNATLLDMAAKAPRTMEDFLEVTGVGAVKAERYGEAFLRAIAAFEEGD